MNFEKITENESRYKDLDKQSTGTLLQQINAEDKTVPFAVEKCLSTIEKLVDAVVERFKKGGRLFYIGAGTSGRLGILDASECPPTYGVPEDMVIGIIAGGDGAIRKAVEFAEDDTEGAWKDLRAYQIDERDLVVGIAASGTTPYVVGGLSDCRKNGITTACITCNPASPISEVADFPIEVEVGPEYVTGSTRMKSGTAQKLVLNMLTTASMIRIGRVQGNRMVDMQLANNKLLERGARMVASALGIHEEKALILLKKHGSVRLAVENEKK